MAFVMYYPRTSLADCRSLPTMHTLMSAFGIAEIHGQSLQKMVAFLKDIGRSESELRIYSIYDFDLGSEIILTITRERVITSLQCSLC